MIFAQGDPEATPLSPEDQAALEDAMLAQQQMEEVAKLMGWKPVPGCFCYGSNTPELLGRCPCKGIDNR